MAEVPQSMALVNAGIVALKVFLAEMGQNSEKNQMYQGRK